MLCVDRNTYMNILMSQSTLCWLLSACACTWQAGADWTHPGAFWRSVRFSTLWTQRLRYSIQILCTESFQAIRLVRSKRFVHYSMRNVCCLIKSHQINFNQIKIKYINDFNVLFIWNHSRFNFFFHALLKPYFLDPKFLQFII